MVIADMMITGAGIMGEVLSLVCGGSEGDGGEK